MAANPLPYMIILLSTLIFEGLLFGGPITPESFTAFHLETPGCAGSGSGLTLIGNCVASFFLTIANIVGIIIGTIAFFLKFMTVGIPGAPGAVGAIITILAVGIMWALVSLVRGK